MVEVSKDGLLPVTEADRDAALAYRLFTTGLPAADYRAVRATELFRDGKRDGWEVIQAFARHRIEATATLQAERDRYREEIGLLRAYHSAVETMVCVWRDTDTPSSMDEDAWDDPEHDSDARWQSFIAARTALSDTPTVQS